MRTIAVSLACAAVWLMPPGVASAEAQKTDIDIKARDGITLNATYFSPGRPGPAMLLLHQCNMNRHAWDQLAKDVADAGVHVLSLDFRGFGESGGDKVPFAEMIRTVIPQKFPSDVDAAYADLVARPDVDESRVAIGGASCGVEQASRLAARRHEIKTLVLLSGSTGDALPYIERTPEVAVFGAASEQDTAAANAIKAAIAASKNSRSTLKMYGGAEHGVPMFARNPDLEPSLLTWLKSELRLSDHVATPLVDNERATIWDFTWTADVPAVMQRSTYEAVWVSLEPTPGQVVHWNKGAARRVKPSVTASRSIVIELKDHPVAPLKNTTEFPNAFPRPGVKKLFDNEKITVWDYTWTPGQATPMHFHDKDAIAVYLKDGVLKSTTPDGQSVVNKYSTATARFNARDRSHSELLVEGEQRAIITELK